MKRTLLALAALVSVATSFSVVEPAEAGRCKQPLPFGGWTWVPCTANPPKKNRRTSGKPVCYFKVRNVDNTDTISYYFQGTRYYLQSKTWRRHKGTCNEKRLEFDRVAGNGTFDSTFRYLDPSDYDLKVWRKGRYLRTELVRD